jgi:type III restriction enzyme
LHKLIIDGIEYEKLADAEYQMSLFEEEEIIGYLNNRLEVKHSVYDAVVYDSEVEREFAEKLDKRDDIKLFVKLPVPLNDAPQSLPLISPSADVRVWP